MDKISEQFVKLNAVRNIFVYKYEESYINKIVQKLLAKTKLTSWSKLWFSLSAPGTEI